MIIFTYPFSGDLSGGQIGGIVVGVLVLLIIVCAVLILVKKRSGGRFFSFQRLGGSGDAGFDNAAYDKGMDSVNINGTSGNKLKNGTNGNISNGNSVGFADFSDSSES